MSGVAAAFTSPAGRFAAALGAVLALLLVLLQPSHSGDVEEYALMTVALARHASPDLRPGDIEEARQALPAFAAGMEALRQGMATPGEVPRPGYYRGRDGNTYAIHFFAYPALAALAYNALPLAGIPAFKCFLAVNLAFVWVLGMALLRLLGSPARAAAGVLLFLLCGGALYLRWSSPESMSAAALLAALALQASGAPLRAGTLAGLAAMHNPPIVFFAAFAPLLGLLLDTAPGWRARARALLAPRTLAGAALAAALFALPVLFNLWAFGVPSIIGKVSTATALASLNRLHSLFFDLNQGMVIGVPALVAALLLWGWRGSVGLGLWAVLFALALAAPALVAHNWNSGAEGMMRYAFWGAMPLLFVLLWRLHLRARWPAGLLAAIVLVQVAAFAHIRAYNPVQFSPLARWVMAHAPAAYNPEPEVFHERAVQGETWLDVNQVDRFEAGGQVRKLMFNVANSNAQGIVCGPGRALAPGQPLVATDRGWVYVNGSPRCTAAHELLAGQSELVLGEGWSHLEHGGGAWDGVWSQAQRARLRVAYDPAHRPAELVLVGHYFNGNRTTAVRIDGTELGRFALDRQPALPVPPGAAAAGSLELELEFDAPHVPHPAQADQRRIAFFLHKVTLR